ncbi:MAG TPA: type II toxin-antitoxin system RelE/ParE family toxin [Terracidiphilus sp.]|nr:type II toxin-antitoxin system RelE/ParE family toxin [Terracidiphilus sp.]
MPTFKPITVVETDEFLAVTRKLMDDVERSELVEYLAYNPTVGVVIQGTGGVRKLRWGLEGRGKRGGARVIYFYHDLEMPLYLLTAYAKNKTENLEQSEIKTLKRLSQVLVEMNRKRRSAS